jgi:hypothetical protein
MGGCPLRSVIFLSKKVHREDERTKEAQNQFSYFKYIGCDRNTVSWDLSNSLTRDDLTHVAKMCSKCKRVPIIGSRYQVRKYKLERG